MAQRTPLSPDGRWLVYGITRASRDNELRVQSSDGGDAIKALVENVEQDTTAEIAVATIPSLDGTTVVW